MLAKIIQNPFPKIERKIRVLMEMINTMISNCDLRLGIWGETILIACYNIE